MLNAIIFGIQVEDVHLVVDPWTRESRGFGFVTMSSLEEAERCIKYLDRSVLEGRVISVEKVGIFFKYPSVHFLFICSRVLIVEKL